MTNLIDEILTDHREVEECFTELESGQGTDQHRRELTDHVIAELVRHSVAEEMYLYPAAREVLPDGNRVADHEIEEHAEAEKIMKELDGMDPQDPRFDSLLDDLISDVRHHIQEEEKDLLPRLREACSEDDMRDLGEKFQNAKQVAPTRPHPSAPDTPPANKLLAPGTGLIDQLRDKLTGRTA